jgi:ankyrin repeat protein
MRTASLQIFPLPPQLTISANLFDSPIVSGEGTLTDNLLQLQNRPIKIDLISLPNEIWVLILQKIKSDKDVVELSTTCRQIWDICQDNWVRRPDQRQFQALVYQLTTPTLREALYHKVVNRMLDKISMPTPHTAEWKQLRDTPPHSKLRGEARHAALIQKMVIISWEGLLQPEVLANHALASQLMRLLIDLSPHLHYAEEYVAKLFHHGLEWETFNQLAHIHLDTCIKLIAKYFSCQDTQVDEFVANQLSFNRDQVSFLLTALKNDKDPSVLWYLLTLNSAQEPLTKIFRSGCNLEQCNLHGQTPLLYAIYSNEIERVNLLLAQGANYNTTDKKGNTPLIAACTHRDALELVNLLLKQPNIDVNAKNQQGETALHYVVRDNRRSKISALLADPRTHINARTNEGLSVVEYAIKQNNLLILRLLLQHPKLDVNASNNPEASALYFAIEHNLPMAIKLFTASSLDLETSISAFNYAIWRERDEMANAFLQNMDAQKQRTFIEQALALARRESQFEVEMNLYEKYQIGVASNA